jgi:hypothetical protein
MIKESCLQGMPLFTTSLHKQTAHCIMTLPFIEGSNFKIKTSFTGSKSSHLDACTSMEHAHLLYAHIVLYISLTHLISPGQNFILKSYTNAHSLPYGQSQQLMVLFSDQMSMLFRIVSVRSQLISLIAALSVRNAHLNTSKFERPHDTKVRMKQLES